MNSEVWEECRLAELCTSVDYGYTTSATDVPLGPRFLRITDIVPGYINWNNVPFCEIDSNDIERYLLNDGDIVIARTGATTGASAYISLPPQAIFASYLVRLKIGAKANSRFISYFLRSPDFWTYIHGVLGDKSAQPNASAKTMTQVKLKLPPLPEQKAIASILGALDDKIEMNREMNETLESMARVIFKSWFVDFDPIPGLGPHKEWQDSPLGKIPKGWRVGTFNEMCEIVMGQSPPGETYNETGEGLPFYQGIRDFGFRFPAKRVYCTTPTRIAQAGDVLLSVRAPVGSLNIASEECLIGRGVAALRIKKQHYGFLYYLMKETQWGWEKFEAEGTVFGSATKTDVQNFSVIIPPPEAIIRFNEIVIPMDKTIKNNEMQSYDLASIRDALLPKLLSGEIRVKDVERFVEDRKE